MQIKLKKKQSKDMELCRSFNEETDDGSDIRYVSKMLNDAIDSIIDTKEESDIDSLFHAGGTSLAVDSITGLNDFELITFIVIR